MPNSLLLNSIKMEENISKARKIQALSFFKDPNSLVAMNHLVMSHYKSVSLLVVYLRTIKTFITGLPLCKISGCIEQLHIVT